MELNEITFGDSPPIDGYGPGFFRVAGQVWQGNLLLCGNAPPLVWDWENLQGALAGLAGSFDLLVIGTGAQMAPPDPRIDAALGSAIIGVEPMATPTACRSYNLLLAEGRRVGAVLLAL